MEYTLAKLIEFVKDQLKFHTERMETFSHNNYRKQKHKETAGMFSNLLEYLENQEFGTDQKFEQLTLSLNPDDLEGLPDELLKELSITHADKIEFAILKMLEDRGGVMSLDQILIEYYRQTGEISKRSTMTNRLYRMANKHLLYSVPNKKGVYSLIITDSKRLNSINDEDSQNELNA